MRNIQIEIMTKFLCVFIYENRLIDIIKRSNDSNLTFLESYRNNRYHESP